MGISYTEFKAAKDAYEEALAIRTELSYALEYHVSGGNLHLAANVREMRGRLHATMEYHMNVMKGFDADAA